MHIFKNLKPSTTDFVVYPYGFTHVDPHTSQSHTWDDGAVMKINAPPEEMPPSWRRAEYFKYLYAEEVQLHKAKALYDHSIAVLRVRGEYEGRQADLTFESDYYCQALQGYLGKYPKCYTWPEYRQSLEDPRHQDTAFVFIEPEDLAQPDTLLYADGIPRFGLVVFPDVISTTDAYLLQLIGVNGATRLREYAERGGVVYASGKAVSILEGVQLLEHGLVQENALLAAKDNTLYVSGCEVDAQQGHETPFEKRLMCLGLIRDDQGRVPAFALSSHFLNLGADPQLQTLLECDMAHSTLYRKDAQTGLSVPYNSEGPAPPLFLMKQWGKGKILINNANPVAVSDRYYPMFYNAIFLAFARNVLVDAQASHSLSFAEGFVKPNVFPGLESDIRFSVEYSVYNLYNAPVTDSTVLTADFKDGFDPISLPEACVVDPMGPRDGRDTKRITCTLTSIPMLTKTEFPFVVNITKPTATQRGDDIVVANATLAYTMADPEGLRLEEETKPVLISAHMAAHIRTDYNVDPICFYPYYGEGYTLDNVVHAANREDTMALEVEHVAIVPLVCPLVDGSKGNQFVSILEFYHQYYHKEVNRVADYTYPWVGKTPERAADYVDYKLLSSMAPSTHLCADWDQPVKVYIKPRDNSTALFPPLPYRGPIAVENAQQTADPQGVDDVLWQHEFTDSERYFEHPQQRMLAYVDTTTEVGARAFYGTNSDGTAKVPDEHRNPNVQEAVVAKRQLALSRADIYFSHLWPYPLPQGLSNNTVITVDRYPNPVCDPQKTFIDHWGEGKNARVTHPGYIDSTRPGGIDPREFSNAILEDCSRDIVRYDQIEARTGGKVRATHYLMPFMGELSSIAHASDLMFFDEGPNRNQYRDYPEVQFVRAHFINYVLEPELSRQGGVVQIILPAGVQFDVEDPVAHNYISFAADQVALHKITVNGRVIRCHFRRGLMPNERNGKASVLLIVLEHLTGPEAFNATVSVEELVFDFTIRPPERLIERRAEVQTFRRGSFLSLPAVRFSFTLPREHSAMKAYEYLAPYARYHIYYQELMKHRYIYGIVEAHHVTNPGLVSSSGGFSIVGAVGTNPVPFREYLTTGLSQFRPISAETSYISWKDVWGRYWVQSLRSAFVDVPPIPAPVRNFMVTTTHELLDPKTGERFQEWPSDRPMDVHLTLKLLNNYPKYYDSTICKENEVRILEAKKHEVKYGYHVHRYNASDPMYAVSTDPADHPWFTDYSLAKYGACFADEGTVLQGQLLTSTQRAKIAQVHLCDPVLAIEQCPDMSTIPTVQRRAPNAEQRGKEWNYSPAVNNYYPPEYIPDDYWDLTHSGLADTPYDKGHPWHMDNLLPNIDTSIIRPHNIIAAPIWKGFGFKVTYDTKYENPALPGRRGWWSDNLQNKDDTVLAGYDTMNQVSVDKADPAESEWIEIDDMDQADTRAAQAKKNMYTCLFNRWRLQHSPTTRRHTWNTNIVRNNIVPILPALSKHDSRLTKYQCGDTYYLNNNISQFDNRLYTGSARDWLYFGANLRGNAKETIHLLFHMDPLDARRLEGQVKVFDGSRFVYWNPCCGPNTFLVVDDPVTVVQARRNDVVIETSLIPTHTTIFNAEFYQIIRLHDPNEMYRGWYQDPYVAATGYGDFTATVYFGEDGTNSRLYPGENGICKLEILNNAGFDINLRKEAMISHGIDQSSLAPTALLKEASQAFQDCEEYRFLRVTAVDPQLSPFVQVRPSKHCKHMVPLFFDFQNINVATIRDGFKGTYFFNITVSPNVPQKFHGRVHELRVEMIRQYVEKLPGSVDDPTKPGFHDYSVSLPSIMLGIKLPQNYTRSWMRGRCYHSMAHATELDITHTMPDELTLDTAKIFSAWDVSELRRLASQIEDRVIRMRAFFNAVNKGTVPMAVSPNPHKAHTKRVQFNTADTIPRFPTPTQYPYDDAEKFIVVRYHAPQLAFGTQSVSDDMKLTFRNWLNEEKTVTAFPSNYDIPTKGAFITTDFATTLVDSEPPHRPLLEQRLRSDAPNLLQVEFSGHNSGDDVAYNVALNMSVGADIEVLFETLDMEYRWNKKTRELILQLNEDIAPGDKSTVRLLLRQFPPNVTQANNANAEDGASYVTFVDVAHAQFDLTPSTGAVRVSQQLGNSHVNLHYQGWVPPRYGVTLYVSQNFTVQHNTTNEFNGRVDMHVTTNATASIPADLLSFVFERVFLSPIPSSLKPDPEKTFYWEVLCKGPSTRCTDFHAPSKPGTGAFYRVTVLVQDDDLSDPRQAAMSSTQLWTYQGPVNAGAIVGGVFGALLVIGLAVGAILFVRLFWLPRRRQAKSAGNKSTTPVGPKAYPLKKAPPPVPRKPMPYGKKAPPPLPPSSAIRSAAQFDASANVPVEEKLVVCPSVAARISVFEKPANFPVKQQDANRE